MPVDGDIYALVHRCKVVLFSRNRASCETLSDLLLFFVMAGYSLVLSINGYCFLAEGQMLHSTEL
jgi:hypothetical protein